MQNLGYGDKVYSPDLKTFDLEGRSGVFGTLASLVVGPVRLLLRVAHNIVILPANLLEEYASGLLLVGTVLCGLGVIDLVVYKKWPLFVSQVVVLCIGFRLKRKAARATYIDSVKHEVNIDFDEVKTYCDGIYDELDSVMEEM